MYIVIRNEVKVMLFRLSAPRIFDQDCSLGDKLLDEVTDEELERNGFPFYADVKIVTNQAFVEKVWYACVKHRYISTDFDRLGRFVDTLHIVI